MFTVHKEIARFANKHKEILKSQPNQLANIPRRLKRTHPLELRKEMKFEFKSIHIFFFYSIFSFP